MIPNLGGIVLAGGQSRRMGQDKALLPFGKGTLVEHVVSVLRPLTPEIMVVAANAEKYAVAGASVIGDRFPDQGPVGGMITGLQAMQERHSEITMCLVVACDMPYLNPDLLANLARLCGESHEAIVPVSTQGVEPLCACYPLEALPKLQAFFDAGGRSVRKALEALPVRHPDSSLWQEIDPQRLMFTNWNTPDVCQYLLADK